MGRVNGILWRKKQSRLKYSKVRGWVMAHGLFYYYCFLLFLPKTNAEYWWSDDDKKWYIVYFLAWKNYCKQLSFSPYASLSHWHLSMNLVFIFLHPRPSTSHRRHIIITTQPLLNMQPNPETSIKLHVTLIPC